MPVSRKKRNKKTNSFGVKVRTKNGVEFYRPQEVLTKTKPLQKITRKELADKGYELVE